jgi:hypothetical protein
MPVQGIGLGGLLTPPTQVGAGGNGTAEGLLQFAALKQRDREFKANQQNVQADNALGMARLGLEQQRMGMQQQGQHDDAFAKLQEGISKGDTRAMDAALAEMERRGMKVSGRELLGIYQASTGGGASGQTSPAPAGPSPQSPAPAAPRLSLAQPEPFGDVGYKPGGQQAAPQLQMRPGGMLDMPPPAQPAAAPPAPGPTQPQQPGGEISVTDPSGRSFRFTPPAGGNPTQLFGAFDGGDEDDARAQQVGRELYQRLQAQGVPESVAREGALEMYKFEKTQSGKTKRAAAAGGGAPGIGGMTKGEFAANKEMWDKMKDTYAQVAAKYKLADLQQMEGSLNNIGVGATSDDALGQLSAMQSFIKAFQGARPTDADWRVVDQANGLMANLENQLKRLGSGGRADAQLQSLKKVSDMLRGELNRIRKKAGEEAYRTVSGPEGRWLYGFQSPEEQQMAANWLAGRVSGIQMPAPGPTSGQVSGNSQPAAPGKKPSKAEDEAKKLLGGP